MSPTVNALDANQIHNHLSELRFRQGRTDANRYLPILLPMHQLTCRARSQQSAVTESGIIRIASAMVRGSKIKIVEMANDRNRIGNQIDWAERVGDYAHDQQAH
jgi:hypothetical protein